MDLRRYPAIAALVQGSDLFEAIFAVKSFAAAMIALWIAMRIGLERPYWAVITSYITAQPLAGAVLSKSAFRIVGTISGAVVAVLMVPVLVNAPVLLCLGLALWLGMCSYLGLLDRSPRSYAFALAGYTAAIIGFASVNDPGHVFMTAALRLQEILLGIVCSTAMHVLVLPASTLAHTRRRVRAILADVRDWLSDALLLASEGGDAERRKLASDLHDLHQLIIHLSFEMGPVSSSARTTRALQLELSRLLPFIGGIEDRLRQLRDARSGSTVPDAVDALRRDLARALRNGASAGGETVHISEFDALLRRTRAMMPRLEAPLSWEQAVLANFLGRLEIMIDGWSRCLALGAALDHGEPVPRALRPRLGDLPAVWRSATHRDHEVALRGALGTIFAVLATCAFWIFTRWSDGAMAVIFAGVWSALFSSLDDARPVMRQVLLGTLAGAVLAVLYVGAVLPRVTDFTMLAGTLAPAFLLIGALAPRPRTALFAIGMFNSFPGFLVLANGFSVTVPEVINTATAQGLGTAMSLIAMNLFRMPGLRRSVAVTVRQGRRELAARARMERSPDRASALSGWTYRMLDRVAVLAPRLQLLRMDPAPVVRALFRDVRTGICLAELNDVARGVSLVAPPGARRAISVVTMRAAAFIEAENPQRAQHVLRAIDTCLRHASRWEGVEQRRRAVVALVGLRRNLMQAAGGCPDEPGAGQAAASPAPRAGNRASRA